MPTHTIAVLPTNTKKTSKKAIFGKTLFPAAIILSLTLSIFVGKHSLTYAEDACKNISDLSDRTACYEKKERETQTKLNNAKALLDSTLNNINQLSSQLTVTQSQLDGIQNDINGIKKDLDEINQNLVDTNQKLSDKIAIRNSLLRNYSKKNILSDLELFFARNENASLTGFQLSSYLYAFNKAANGDTLKMISALNSEIQGYEQDKKSAEELKGKLETAQKNLLALTNDLAARKNTAQGQANELSQKTTQYEKELEDLQGKILALKYSDENGSVGDYEQPSSKTPDAPFKPAFAAFSYGAYTHGNGMSQYGAKGRADSGQSYTDILKFYYKVGTTKPGSFPKTISVQGYGTIDFQYYLYGIAEMPSDWDTDALKAQAIAARSYAYKSNKPICITQSCQVFSKSKADNPPSKWKDAVDSTKGVILDNPKTSQYSSTTGGYINNIGWDVKGEWPSGAYEKKAGSPWFYKAWYTKSYNDNSTCGHPHPWLKSSEMADILNAWVVYTKGTGSEKSHISPLTTSCWGGDPYSADKMGEVAEKYIDNKYTSVSDVSVDISNGGYTSQVTLKTNNGSVSISGSVFKTVFNLRASGYISIKNTLFDFEVVN